MSLPTRRGAAAAAAQSPSSTNTRTATWSGIAGVVAGDTAFVGIGWSFSGTTLATPAGWTLKYLGTNGTGNQLAVFSKVLTAGDITAGGQTFTFSATARASLVLEVYSGAVTVGTLVGNSQQTTGPTVVTVGTNAHVVTFFDNTVASGTPNSLSFTTGTTDASVKTNILSGGSPSGSQLGLICGRIATTTPGSYSTGNVNGASGSATYQGVSFEVNAPTTNTAPTSNAGPDQSGVTAGSTVMLDGTGSSDPEGDTLSYAWTQTSGPAVALSSPTAAQPTFTAPPSATLVFSLTVTDSHGLADSTPATVTITTGAADSTSGVSVCSGGGWVAMPVHEIVTVPGPVVAATAVANLSDNSIDVSWLLPADDGESPLTGIEVFRDQSDATVTDAPTATSHHLTGFTTGVTYTVKVRAVNAVGAGPWVTLSVKMGTVTPPLSTGFRAAILATSPQHYYPMNSTYPLADQGLSAANRPLINTGGGVTFGAGGAVFDGTDADYLTAADHTDFAISSTKTAMAIFVAITIPTYNQPDFFHWMSKGGDLAGNFAWAMRLYGDPDSARKRNISAYYFNPNPSFDINGNDVPSRRGSGSYLAPPSGSPDFGGNERHNGPVHSGEIGVEHYLGIEFTYAGANGYAGQCRMWYGDSAGNPMTLISNRGMDDDALVTPVYTNGRLFVGRRGDKPQTLIGTLRRLGFWNRLLTQAEWRSFANTTTMAKTED